MVSTINFTTGPATLPDVGVLSYNGCQFGPLVVTDVSGLAVKDEAMRTVKYMEYTITVDGYVTLPDGATDTSPTMATLRKLLSAQAGALVYQGRGCDILVNVPGNTPRDVAWGPVPNILEFQPLGSGRSAKIKWTVVTRIAETKPSNQRRLMGVGGPIMDVGNGNIIIPPGKGNGGVGVNGVAFGGIANIPLLQFNYETVVTYDDANYATISVRGILEIPLTRNPLQSTRTLTQTADDMRGIIEIRALQNIDLTRFHVTKRNLHLSRDKRTLVWDFEAEEQGYQDMPPYSSVARGTYTVRPAKIGMGLCNWLCTLRGTYNIRKDQPRRL